MTTSCATRADKKAEREGFEATLGGLTSHRPHADFALIRLKITKHLSGPHFTGIVPTLRSSGQFRPQFVPSGVSMRFLVDPRSGKSELGRFDKKRGPWEC